jgi:hypothetical protein
MKDILSTYYKCTFSAITHKLNVSGHILISVFSLVWYVEPVSKVCPTFKLHPVCVYTCAEEQTETKFSKSVIHNHGFYQVDRASNKKFLQPDHTPELESDSKQYENDNIDMMDDED